MKKIFVIIMTCIMIFSNITATASEQTEALKGKDVFRAAWIATVYNLDFPSKKSDMLAQQQEFVTLLDKLQDIGLNAVIVQIRPKGDALYKSSINPWSEVLTGTQGKDPGYDPLEFMLAEAHKRGMEFHAWLNPYRVTTPNGSLSSLAPNHPGILDSSMIFKYNNTWYYNPELESVKQHIVDTVSEIVTNYAVDGIHFDDYFYPEKYPLPANEDKDGPTANARRGHINDMIQRVHNAIEQINPEVEFGVSPIAVWKNKEFDELGSDTDYRSAQAYYYSCADTRLWVKEGWIDYIVPQIYFETSHSMVPYETMVAWWNDTVEGTDVKVYVGHGVYRTAVSYEIEKQLDINEKYENVVGSVYYRAKELLADRQGQVSKIKEYYTNNPPIIIEEKPDDTVFSDVEEGHWGKPYIDMLVSNGAVKGYQDGTFKPSQEVTRMEFIKMLTGAIGVETNDADIVEWYTPYINKATELGITQLIDLTTEEARNTPITRYEVSRVLSYSFYEMINNDISFIKDEYSAYAAAVIAAGIMVGDEKGFFNESSTLSRVEASTVVVRVIDKSFRKEIPSITVMSIEE